MKILILVFLAFTDLSTALADFDYVYESETKDTPEYDAQLQEILTRFQSPEPVELEFLAEDPAL